MNIGEHGTSSDELKVPYCVNWEKKYYVTCDIIMKGDHLGFFINIEYGWIWVGYNFIALSVYIECNGKNSREKLINLNHKQSCE